MKLTQINNRLYKNIIYRGIEAVIVATCIIYQHMLLTHYLPQKEVGKVSLLLASMFFITAISYVAGIMSIAIKELTQGENSVTVISTAFILQVAVALILAVTILPLIITLDYFQHIRTGLLTVVSIYLLIIPFYSFQAIILANQEMGKMAGINIAQLN